MQLSRLLKAPVHRYRVMYEHPKFPQFTSAYRFLTDYGMYTVIGSYRPTLSTVDLAINFATNTPGCAVGKHRGSKAGQV